VGEDELQETGQEEVFVAFALAGFLLFFPFLEGLVPVEVEQACDEAAELGALEVFGVLYFLLQVGVPEQAEAFFLVEVKEEFDLGGRNIVESDKERRDLGKGEVEHGILVAGGSGGLLPGDWRF